MSKLEQEKEALKTRAPENARKERKTESEQADFWGTVVKKRSRLEMEQDAAKADASAQICEGEGHP